MHTRKLGLFLEYNLIKIANDKIETLKLTLITTKFDLKKRNCFALNKSKLIDKWKINSEHIFNKKSKQT